MRHSRTDYCHHQLLRYLLALTLPLLCVTRSFAQSTPAVPLDGADGRPLALEQFRPRSMLKLEHHLPERAKYPVVDVHTHFEIRFRHAPQSLEEFMATMDRTGIAVCVSLDGKLGEAWDEHAKYLWTKYRNRFLIFVHLDWQGSGTQDDPASWDCQRPDFARHVVEQLREAHAAGASGLKIFKQLGLEYKNPDGSRIMIDDPRWDPIWQTCGELGMPVLIHTADPAAFFLPINAENERWEELHRHPDWSYAHLGPAARDELFAARNRVVARHPATTFIEAHIANNPEDLAMVSAWLDAHPNLYVELASRIGELGRQPYTAHEFLTKYADRILFGTDGPQPELRLRRYFQFLETRDESFPYSEKDFPPQGFWQIHGIGLSDDVLKKIYFENAARLIPGVKERLP